MRRLSHLQNLIVFDVDFPSSLSKGTKKKPRSSLGVSGITIVLVVMIERFNRVEAKADRLKARLSLLEVSSSQLEQ